MRQICMILFCTMVGAQVVSAQPAAAAPQAGAPVVVDGRTLFRIGASLGPFTPAERADAASRRITRAIQDVTLDVEKVTAITSDSSTDIAIEDRVLLTVTDADAAAAGQTREQLSTLYVAELRTAITEMRVQYSSRSLLLGVLYLVLATGAFLALLIGLAHLRRIANAKLGRMALPGIRFQRVELASPSQIQAFLTHTVNALRFVLVLLAFYAYVPLALSFFPWTRGYVPRIIEYIVTPIESAGVAILEYLPSLFVVIITCVAAYMLIRLSHFLFRGVAEGTITWTGFYPEWADPTHKILRFLILAVTLVVIFPYLPGSGSPAFQGISIFLGVLFSLGSTSAVANIIGGVILTYTRAFRLGDRVKIAETTGDVVEKSLLATRIRTIKNEYITVPNSMVLGSHIVNYSSPNGGAPLVLHTTVTIGYDAPWRQVHELLIAAAQRTQLLLKDPAPFVLQTSLDDNYVSYQLNAFTMEASRMAVTYSELHQNIQDVFNEAGVEIMSPHYRAIRDGSPITIPAQYSKAQEAKQGEARDSAK